ncbi:RagB/SusD family nutrient uptake outer membrane protein [uncultured Pontibacter sp.]|uniref:RagB/SusD family nutrient uptake outer membrane protein n=1 Tax=uncultured Pontibacter sp. TaxID=453356 RepID=UPI0026157B59|nr:RagB/SusD family nutrient uptake outer membrane protein [uncultured Pontibacter sp.]
MLIKVKNTIAGLLILLSTTACQEWLDVTPSAQIRQEEQFKTETGFKDALIGTYISMAAPELYAKDMTWNMVDLFSQQYATLPTLAAYNELQRFQYKSNRSMPRVDALWNKSYNVIANINNALGFIEKNKEVLHPISHDIIKGELLGLRAFLHFDLMRLYGYGNMANRTDVSSKLAIPYVTEYSKDLTPQLTYSQTFELMAKDIETALGLLKADPIYPNAERPAGFYEAVNRDGFFSQREQRMNYYAVKALQARMLLWQGGADKLNAARLAAEEVINSSPARLIVSESYPVSADPTLHPEHLFSLNVTAFADIVERYLNAESSTNYDALFLTTSAAAEIYETSNVNIGVADVRYNTLLESQSRGLVSKKLRQRGITRTNILPLIKLPEMYFIAAEYYANTGELSTAIDLLNRVRSSRGIIHQIPEDASQDEVKLELFKEHRKEFVSEGQLFFYYKRLGSTTIPGLSATTEVGDKIYVLPYPDSEIEFGNRIQ